MSEVVYTDQSENSMHIAKKYAYPVSVLILFGISQFYYAYTILSLLLLLFTILMVLDRLGKGIVLREIIALHGIFICILMPVLGYLYYTKNNGMARLWVRYMPVPENEYFGYAFPAMCLFVAALCWPIRGKVSDQGALILQTLQRAKKPLNERPAMGIYLVITGVVAFFLTPFLPGALQFVATLIFWGAFAGTLYLYFTETAKNKRLIFVLFIIFILSNALQSGMFTIAVYMGITLFSFFFLGRKFAFWKKMLAFLFCVFALMLIQSVKQSYRVMVWGKGYTANKFVLFSSLLIDKWNTTTDISEDDFFPIYYRTNQGFNVSLVMQRYPEVKPFDNGNNLALSFAAAFVPRLFWPDKPEAGGKANMKYYAGVEIKGWSTNVGPLGEAYGSFGKTGGIAYMFFLGVLIRWAYRKVFVIALRIPLLIFWIPVLFYPVTYSAESDTLQIVNSLVKSAFFIWLLFKIKPMLFGIIKEKISIKYVYQNQ